MGDQFATEASRNAQSPARALPRRCDDCKKKQDLQERAKRSYNASAQLIAENAQSSSSKLLDPSSRSSSGLGLGHSISRIPVMASAGTTKGATMQQAEPNPPSGISPLIQAKLAISQPGDALEQEADRIAEKVMTTAVSSAPPIIQRYAGQATGVTNMVLASVDSVLANSGRPLEPALRQDMEQRFGHDFSRVRVHSGGAAEQSAREVNANAYAVGHNIVFGAGRFAPGTHEGQRLIAHELTHVVQQSGSEWLRIGRGNDNRSTHHMIQHAAKMQYSVLQRACSSASECSGRRATLTQFVEDTENKPENISKQEKRKNACTTNPPKASFTSDGHGARAAALTGLLATYYKSRASNISGIFVDKDIPADYGAVTYACKDFMPPLAGVTCTFVPDVLEAQGRAYQRGEARVGGTSRQDWLTNALSILTHETEHARFDASPNIAKPNAAACTFEAHQSNLSEMAAALSEMHVYYRAALAKPSGRDRFKQFYAMFANWVQNPSECIFGIIKELRCSCECADADYYITKTAESVMSNQKWDTNERTMIHTELREPKWGLKWPIAPPPAVDVLDLPTTAPAPFKLE